MACAIMRCALVTLLLVHVDAKPRHRELRADLDLSWESYVTTFNKQYKDDIEEAYRRSIWEQNLDFIQKHNIEADLGLHSYSVGVNEYADLSLEEFRTQFLGTRVPETFINSSRQWDDSIDIYGLPDTVDWRLNGSVTPVQNQGGCGSCWAFSATGSLEGQWYKKKGTLVKLSEQNLVDCSRSFGNQGCAGGWMQSAFEYIIRNEGIDTAASYPYKGADMSCKFDKAFIGATCRGYINLPKGKEDSMMKAVSVVGPVSVAIDAGQRGFQLYKSGVYVDPNCSQGVNHGVLVIGYGTFGGQDYWLVKNSWGTSWGDNGYIKMARNKNNQCAIASYGIYPVV